MSTQFHAYCHLQDAPVEFDAEQSQVFLDDANGYLVVYKEGVFSIRAVLDKNIEPQTVDFIRRAPVLSVRFSLDKRHMAIQRSHTDVDVVNLADRSEVCVSCKGKGQGNMVHGLFWLNSPVCDLALVTLTGVELLKFSAAGDALKLVKHDKRPVCWFNYLHSSRLLLLCTGKDYSTIQCFQFMPTKLLKFPDFDPEQGPAGKKSRLEVQDFAPCKLYDKLCCIQVSAQRQELIVYQLGQSAIGRLCSINLFTSSERFGVSVIDNLLVVHNNDSRITMVFDVLLHQWTGHPIVAPLPLGGPPPEDASAQAGGGGEDEGGSGALFSPADDVVRDWSLEAPHYVLDKKNGKLWTLQMHLEHLAMSCGDKVNLCRFLLMRSDSRDLLLRVINGCIKERETLYCVFQIFSIINEAASGARNRQKDDSVQSKWWFYDPSEDSPAASPGSQASQGGRHSSAVVLSQREMYDQVFKAVDTSEDLVDLDYMVAVSTEYLRSLSSHGILPEPFLVDKVIQLSVRSKPPRYHALHQLLQYHVIQDSRSVAKHLLDIAHNYPPALQLSIDMLHRLGSHQEVAEVMVAHKQLLPVMKYIKQHATVVVPAATLLKAARDSNDDMLFHTTYRFTQAMHYQMYANHKRTSPNFLPQDACQEFSEYFNRLPSTEGGAQSVAAAAK